MDDNWSLIVAPEIGVLLEWGEDDSSPAQCTYLYKSLYGELCSCFVGCIYVGIVGKEEALLVLESTPATHLNSVVEDRLQEYFGFDLIGRFSEHLCEYVWENDSTGGGRDKAIEKFRKNELGA